MTVHTNIYKHNGLVNFYDKNSRFELTFVIHLSILKVNVLCDLSYSGLKCFDFDQPNGQCVDYEIRFMCEPNSCHVTPTHDIATSSPSLSQSTPYFVTGNFILLNI